MNIIIHGLIRGGRLALVFAGLTSLFACGGGGPETDATTATEEKASVQPLDATTSKTVYKDRLASATYLRYDATGCYGFGVETRANVFKANTDGSLEKGVNLWVQVYSYNSCTNEGGYWSGIIDTADVKISKDLSSARATGTVLVGGALDVGNTSVPSNRMVVLDLTWSGGVLVTQPKTKFITILPGQKQIVTVADSSRQSDNVTGTLVLDGIELLGQVGSGIGGFVASHATVDVVRNR